MNSVGSITEEGHAAAKFALDVDADADADADAAIDASSGVTDAGVEAELYQLWVNLPPWSKFAEPAVQLLEPVSGGIAEVMREGETPIRRAQIGERRLDGGAVKVRHRQGHILMTILIRPQLRLRPGGDDLWS